jgi:hypothetical protein
VDLLITEDRGVHTKAAILGIADRVFTIDAFLEKVSAENPDLVEYKVLAVKKTVFGKVDVAEEFFDSFRQDYGAAAFDRGFARKADETAYVCQEGQDLVAFLYLKVEGPDENYGDIDPRFTPSRRLKIGTFKVVMNGYKLGERFLKIIFDNALRQQVDEIYVTIFQHNADQERLIRLLQEFGFTERGQKKGQFGSELVLVRSMRPPTFNVAAPALTFPYVSVSTQCHIVPISELPYEPLARQHPTNRVTVELCRTIPTPERDTQGIHLPERQSRPQAWRRDRVLPDRGLLRQRCNDRRNRRNHDHGDP